MSSPKGKRSLMLATRKSPQNRQVASNKRKRDGDSTERLPVLVTRMSPDHFEKFIKHGPTPTQVNDINSMGFGGLLQLKTDKLPGSLAYWFVSNFNTLSSSLLDGALRVADEDIHLAIGVPMGPLPVDIATTADKSEVFLEAKKKWLLQFGSCDKVQIKDVYSKMIAQIDGGVDFKRNFIVYVVFVFLMGVRGAVCSLRILKCLSDVDKISSMNWCAFIRKNLIESVNTWKRLNDPNVTFGGPVMVLVFIYLDRVSFKFNEIPRVFPTLSTWTKEAISARVSAEKAFGLRKGAVESRVVKAVAEPSKSVPSSSRQDEGVTNPAGCSNIVNKLAEAAVKFAESYDNFYVVLREARVESPDSDVVRQMASLAESLFQGFSCGPHEQEPSDLQGKSVNVNAGRSEEKEVELEFDNKNVEPKDLNAERTKTFREFASHKVFSSEDELLAALVKMSPKS